MTFFILWYQARKAKAASCRELAELLKKKTAAEDEAKRAREAAAREQDGFAREKAKMEKQAQEERDNIAREKEQWNNELQAAARQNRKMATALLQVLSRKFMFQILDILVGTDPDSRICISD